MNIIKLKRDIQILLDLGYIIKPNDHKNNRILYLILCFNKHNTLFRLLPFDIIKYNLFPYLYSKFDINRDINQFKIVIEKKKIKWVIYFNPSFDNSNIPITKIISSNGMNVSLSSVKKTIESRYYTLYISWLHRFTLPFIMLQIRIIMNKWLLANNCK